MEGSIDDGIRCHVHESISGVQLSIQPTDICHINYISVNAPSDRSSVSVTTVGHCSPG